MNLYKKISIALVLSPLLAFSACAVDAVGSDSQELVTEFGNLTAVSHFDGDESVQSILYNEVDEIDARSTATFELGDGDELDQLEQANLDLLASYMDATDGQGEGEVAYAAGCDTWDRYGSSCTICKAFGVECTNCNMDSSDDSWRCGLD